MSIEITIEPQGLNGLVAEGSNLLRAARRLGLRLPADCTGRGACDSCAVKVTAGANCLSAATAAEQDLLGPEKLDAGERLACQVWLEQTGAVTFGAVERSAEEDPMRDFHKEFSELPLTKKFATLFRLEVNALNDALGAILSLPSQIGGAGVDFMAQKGREAEAAERAAQAPATDEKAEEPAPAAEAKAEESAPDTPAADGETTT
jgi:ferredoxin